MKAKNIDLYDVTVRSNWELCFDQYQIRAPLKSCIKGFHVMSYQANFASHHTRDCYFDFLFTWSSIGKHNRTYRNSI